MANYYAFRMADAVPAPLMKTTRHDVLECPVCRYTMDSSTAINVNRAPGPGDVTVCWHCGSVLMYGEGLTLRQTWDFKVLEDPAVMAAVSAWLDLKMGSE